MSAVLTLISVALPYSSPPDAPACTHSNKTDRHDNKKGWSIQRKVTVVEPIDVAHSLERSSVAFRTVANVDIKDILAQQHRYSRPSKSFALQRPRLRQNRSSSRQSAAGTSP
jgi:hypothetical protein